MGRYFEKDLDNAIFDECRYIERQHDASALQMAKALVQILEFYTDLMEREVKK